MSRAGALAVLLACAAAGCGSSASQRPPTLAAGTVPYLPSSVTLLTPGFLAREAQLPALGARLRHWGFQVGARRYFQGESRQLQLVDSRTLRFRQAAGARAFVTFMRGHLQPILGSFPRVGAYMAGARRGVLAVGQECQCHLANPTFLALVAGGRTVSWLEINGPAATRRRMTALLARAP